MAAPGLLARQRVLELGEADVAAARVHAVRAVDDHVAGRRAASSRGSAAAPPAARGPPGARPASSASFSRWPLTQSARALRGRGVRSLRGRARHHAVRVGEGPELEVVRAVDQAVEAVEHLAQRPRLVDALEGEAGTQRSTTSVTTPSAPRLTRAARSLVAVGPVELDDLAAARHQPHRDDLRERFA